MADAVLSVALEGDIRNLQASLANGIKSVQTASDQIDRSSLSIRKDFDSLNKTKFTFGSNFQNESRKLQSSALAAGNAVKKSSKDYTGLSRILQDLPFGFIGIQNNLTQLLPAAGIAGVAFSALVSAITFASVGTDNWTRGLGGNKKAIDDAAKASEEYKDSLTGLNKQIFDAKADTGEEISRLDTLFRATQNLSLSLKDRTLALKELQDKYPNYFQDLNNESILTAKAGENYKLLRQQIVATSLARAADKDTAKQGEVIFENLNKRRLVQAQINKLQKENAELSSRNLGTTSGGTVFGQAIADNINQINELQAEVNGYDKVLKNANTTIFNNSQLQDAIIRKFGIQAIVTEDAAKAQDKLNRATQTGIDINAIGVSKDTDIQKFSKNLAKRLSSSSDFQQPEIITPVSLDFQLVSPEQTSPAEILKQRLEEEFGEDFRKGVSDIFSNSIGSTLSDSFQQLGSALAEGGNPIEAFGQSVLQGFGNFLSEFGGLLIKYGLAATAYGKLQAALLTPGGAIIAGPLAIAAGIALKIASGAISGLVSGNSQSDSSYQIPKFASGVTNFGGGVALVGERGPELVNLPTGSNVITNQNTNRLLSNQRASTSVVIPDVRIQGSDLVVVFNRANKNLNRTT